MVDRWSDRLARVDRAIDLVMSETVRIVPQRASDFADAVEDEDRPAVNVLAVLTIWRGEADMGGDDNHIRNARVATQRAELQVQKSLLSGLEIRKNDRVEAPAKNMAFHVDRVDRYHPGRVALSLSYIGELET